MDSLAIENTILKYLINEATSEELDCLSKWISIPGNEEIFYSFIKTHYEITTIMSKPNVEKIKSTLFRDIKKDKKRVKNQKIQRTLKFAAVFVILLGLGYIYKENSISKVNSTTVLNPKNEPVTIILNDGTTKIIRAGENGALKDTNGKVIGRQSNTKLTYVQEGASDKLIYNTLKVPNGKRFDLVLSDGTHVYLNSGTILRYPVNFLESLDREVFLTGEAYFKVQRDEQHPFVVNTDHMQVEVLGTSFNMSNYPGDQSANTVLVEGSVALYRTEKNKNKAKPTFLEPGFKGEWYKNGNDIAIEGVDTELYTAWVQGKLIFRNTSFLKIRQVLERHYNVKIRNSKIELDKQLFDATFDIETIEEVLESFSKSFSIDYEIINNEVIIT